MRTKESTKIKSAEIMKAAARALLEPCTVSEVRDKLEEFGYDIPYNSCHILVTKYLPKALGKIEVSNKLYQIPDLEIAETYIDDYFNSLGADGKSRYGGGRTKGQVNRLTWLNIKSVIDILDGYGTKGLKLDELYEKFSRINSKVMTGTLLDRLNSVMYVNDLGLDYFSKNRVRLGNKDSKLIIERLLIEKGIIKKEVEDSIKKIENSTQVAQYSSRFTEIDRKELRVQVATVIYLTRSPLSIEDIRKNYLIRYHRPISEITVRGILDEFKCTIPDLIECRGDVYRITEYNEVLKIIDPAQATVQIVVRVPEGVDISELEGMNDGRSELSEEYHKSKIYEVTAKNSKEFCRSLLSLRYKGLVVLSPISYRNRIEKIFNETLNNLDVII